MAAHQASLSFTIFWSFLKLMSIESVMLSNRLILFCSLLCLHSVFPSIRALSNESALHIRWTYYWNFSFSTSPPSEYSGLVSFMIDCYLLQWTNNSDRKAINTSFNWHIRSDWVNWNIDDRWNISTIGWIHILHKCTWNIV